MMITVDIARTI